MKIKLFLLVILLLLLLGIGIVEGATVQAHFNKTYVNASGTSNEIRLDYLSSVSNATVEFRVSRGGFDNSGEGDWAEYFSFPITTVPTEYAQYKIVISGTTWELYNVTGALEATGTNSNFWSLVQSDGDDIRVFDQNGNQLYFWIESWDYSNQQAVIWVNVTSGISELNIAYGNPSALPSTYNDLSKVFVVVVYDDFEDGVLSDLLLIKDFSGDANVSETNGVLTISNTGSTDGSTNTVVYFNISCNFPIIVETIVTSSNSRMGTVLVNPSANYYVWHWLWRADQNAISIYTWDTGSSIDSVSSAFTTVEGDPHLFRTIFNGDTVIGYVENLNTSANHTINYTNASYNFVGYPGISVYRTTANFEYIRVYKIKTTDPADFGTPSVKYFSCINPTLELNGNLIQYTGELNETNPSSGKISINSTYFVSGINWANFSATSGNFNAILSFDYTLDVPESTTTTFEDMWVNASFYVPEGTVTSNTTFEFNTSYLGFPVYSYHLVVYVNGQQYSNYKVSDHEISGVKYITVHVLDVPTGSVTIAIHTIFKPTNITVYIYDEISKKELTTQTLNLTLLDPNFNVLNQTTITGNTTIQVVYSGYAYIRAKDSNGVTRQIQIYVPLGNNTTAYIYFPTSNVILIQFNIQDNTGLFKSGDIIIKKYIDREVLVEIDRQKITADYVTYHYLIANEPYQIYVSNGQEVRSIGYFSSPVSKTTTLTIGTLTIEPLTTQITYYIAYDAPNGTVTLEYSSPEPVTIAKFWINATNGTNLYYAESTEQSGSLVYIGKANESYIVHFYIKTASGAEIHVTRLVSTAGVQPIRFPLFPEGWPEWLYNLVAIGIIVIVVLLFGEVRADIACVLGAAMAALLWYWGWLRVSGLVVAVAMIIAGAAVIHRARRVGM